MNSYFKTDNINVFISQLHTLTNIDCDIIRNLITLNLLDKIIINDSILINDNSYIIFLNHIKLVDCYQYSPEFILASYPLQDSTFYAVPFDRAENIHKLKNNDPKQPLLLILHYDNNIKHTEFLINLDLSHYSNFPNQNLTLKEKQNYENYIVDLLSNHFYGINSIKYDSTKLNFILPTEDIYRNMIIEYDEFNLDKINKIILKEIQLYNNKYLSIYNRLVEDIKNKHSSSIFSFFERSLLEEEMKTF